jgi:hypothetical protein
MIIKLIEHALKSGTHASEFLLNGKDIVGRKKPEYYESNQA